MSNKYNAIVCEKTRYYKGVPYITSGILTTIYGHSQDRFH